MVEESNRKVERKRVAERKDLVNFALQFEGNPYVYGGTSLTKGADCSGFVMSVFREFGYELPRVASAQFNASRKKEISEMEVGDLVFYGGGISHVALYIGKGKSNPCQYLCVRIKLSPIMIMKHRWCRNLSEIIEGLGDCTKNVESCRLYTLRCKSFPQIENVENLIKSSYAQSYPHYHRKGMWNT